MRDVQRLPVSLPCRAVRSRPEEVRVRSFRQRVSDAWCSSDCDLKYLAARARTGAFNDQHDGDWHLESTAKMNANGLFRVSGFDAITKSHPGSGETP